MPTRKSPSQDPATPAFVDAKVIAGRYSISPRYVLLLADQGRIPCLRLGRKAVRFSLDEVARALEGK
jgi:hypothetical protein